MTPEQFTDLIRYTIFVAVEISAPMLFVLLLIGLAVSVFQSVTQITETTLLFIPKILFFSITFAFAFPWIMKIMSHYTHTIFIDHWNNVISMTNYAM